jgi:glycosyltransferase involved in cell wall biosynthesis
MIEIRLPTYKRPQLLARALASILAQTSSNWRCIVLEDSLGNEGADIVKDIGDSRIAYRGCSRNRGLLENLRLAFSPEPFFEDACYASVLEDDNYYRPQFVANACHWLQQSGLSVYCGNSQIAQLSDSGAELIEERYTMSAIYGNSVREIDLSGRLRAFILGFPVANLSLVWRLGMGIDFSVSNEQYNHIAQEKRRAFVWQGSMIYDPEPNSVWTNHFERLFATKSTHHNRRWRISEMTMNGEWIKLARQYNFAPSDHEREAVRLIGLNSFTSAALKAVSGPDDVLRLIKNLMLWLLYNPAIRSFEAR